MEILFHCLQISRFLYLSLSPVCSIYISFYLTLSLSVFSLCLQLYAPIYLSTSLMSLSLSPFLIFLSFSVCRSLYLPIFLSPALYISLSLSPFLIFLSFSVCHSLYLLFSVSRSLYFSLYLLSLSTFLHLQTKSENFLLSLTQFLAFTRPLSPPLSPPP